MGCTTGERAEMSCMPSRLRDALRMIQRSGKLTKDRRYESKDSREMENCPLSPSMARWLDVAVALCERPQNPVRSGGGEGYWSVSASYLGCSNTTSRGHRVMEYPQASIHHYR